MKVSEAQEKVYPFIQHISVAVSDITITSKQLENPHNHANAWCLTTGCMSWSLFDIGSGGYCKLLDKD